jgi:hypothetical protein
MAVRGNGKAKMDNAMAERSGEASRQSKDSDSIGKALSIIATAKKWTAQNCYGKAEKCYGGDKLRQKFEGRR